MNQETIEFLRELADKLGTTGEHLWMVLVAQAPIAAITSTIFLLTSIIATSAALYYTFWCKKNKDEDGTVLGFVISMILLVVTFIAVAGTIPVIAAGFFNPEYWALQQVLNK